MSILFKLDTEDDDAFFSGVTDILIEYQTLVNNAEPLFQIEGKKLDSVCQVLPKNLYLYNRYFLDMKTLEEYLVIKRNQIQAKLWKKYVEGYPKALATKDIQNYILGDADYVALSRVIIEVQDLKEKFKAITEAFEQMNWQLSNITKLRIAEIQETIL
jgi:hypothetical protein